MLAAISNRIGSLYPANGTRLDATESCAEFDDDGTSLRLRMPTFRPMRPVNRILELSAE